MNARALTGLLLLTAWLTGCGSTSSPPGHEPNLTPLATPLRAPALFVSPRGNDAWSGLLPEPNAAGSDGPLATPQRALEALRRLRLGGELAESSVTVYLREGRYRLTRSLVLTSQDSGSPGGEVSVESYPGERAILTGGTVVDGFGPVSDPDALARLPRATRGHVLQADLGSGGLADVGSVSPATGNRLELYYRGKLMTLARYPNQGWLTIASVPQSGPQMLNPGLDRDTSEVPRGRHYGRFTYAGDRPRAWKPDSRIWVHGYWTWDWAEQYLRVDRIDLRTREVWPVAPHHVYGYTAGQRFAFLNVMEELDTPGEWYLDADRRRLYYWPPGPIEPGDVVLPVLQEPLVVLDGAHSVTIRALTLEAGRGNAIRVTGSSGCSIQGCLIRNVGQTAVVVDGGNDCAVTGCEIRDVGAGGITLSGGDRRSLTPARHLAAGNHIHDFAQRLRTYQPAIALAGVGQRVANNLIHDAPHMAVAISGNDHLLEYNEVHHIAQETGDVGAFYLGRDWTERGTVIRWNYFHDLLGPGLYGVMAVYLDDAASGTTVEGNLFVRAGRGVLIGGGRDNTVEHNVFVDCEPAVTVDARGLGWARVYALPSGDWRLYAKLEAVGPTTEPWASHYPRLARILEAPDPAAPEGNVIRANLASGGRWIDLDPAIPAGAVVVEGNFTTGNPGFVDPAHGDYRLRADSAALAAGFRQVRLEAMGLPKAP
jgi:hypothetical protein